MNLRVFYLTRRGISDGYVVSYRANAALFRRVRCCKQPQVAASTTPAQRQPEASLKASLKASPKRPIKSFGVCACFFLVFSLSL